MELNAHDLAMKYLNSRDRTSHEIKVHLASKGISKEEIRECLQYLSECGLMDDENYCERYILYGMEKGRGPLRLERDLLDRGVAPETIRSALETHFGSGGERKAATACVEKLLKQADYRQAGEPDYTDESEFAEEAAPPPPDEKELARIGRRLASQGYHSHVIYEILGKLRR